MEIISCFSERTKRKQNALLLLSKSGQLYFYNDSQIEHYLLQYQSKSTPSLPDNFVVKLPFSDSSITISQLYTDYFVESNIMGEEQLRMVKKYSNLFVFDKRESCTNHSSSTNFNGFTKTNSLYITGHQDGSINFWDASCALLFPMLSIKHQSDEGNASIGIPVTALHFDISSQVLVTGDQNGLAQIITFKTEQHASENIFSFLQAKQVGNYTIRTVKVKGAIQSICLNAESKLLAIGTDKGFGIKKVHNKKRLSGICCYASVVYGPSSDVGLALVLASGKVEIRSLPDLSLLKEESLGGFAFLSSKSCANFNCSICASPQGELIMVNGDQEILFFSVLFQKGTCRNLDYISQVYKKNIVDVQEESSNATNAHKEKKKGIFSMVKDLTGNKSKHSQETDIKDSGASTIEELSAVFSTANFPLHSESNISTARNEEDLDLDIDDIDLEDTKEKAKEQNFTILNKQKLGKKLQAIKGKLKTKTDEKLNSPKVGNENDMNVGAIDQIKKKYGYSVNNESTSIAKNAESKLSDNVQKLKGINDRASDMKDAAQSFSSLAKELLRTAQKGKGSW